jgi:hypothetical protein
VNKENIIQMDSIYNFADLVEISVREKILDEEGAKNAYSSYNAHFKPLIENMDIRDFTFSIACQLFKQVKDKLTSEGKRYDNIFDSIRKTIRPTLDAALAEDKIKANPLDFREFKKLFPKATVEKQKLQQRIATKKDDAFVKLAREIYSKILNFKQEVKPSYKRELKYDDRMIQAAFFFSNMCGRRVTEFIKKLKYEEITEEYIVITKTKSKKIEEYPLPTEIIDRILPLYETKENGDFKFDRKGNKIRRTGLVFEMEKRTYKKKLEALLETIQTEFRPGQKLTGHDNRNLIVSIVVDEGWTDRKTANQLISHAVNDVDNAYFNTLSTQKRVMNNYWELLRGNLKSIHQED